MADVPHGRVVVGVDGSASSEEALAWAEREANLRGARLDVVHAWTMTEVTSQYGAPFVGDPDALQRASRALLEDMVEGLADERDGGPPELLLQSVAGPAAQALMQSAAHAELLVVGARGLGGLRGLAARLGEPAVRTPRTVPDRRRPRRSDARARDGVGGQRRART